MASAIKYVTKVILPEGKLVYEYNPLYNYRKKDNEGMLTDMITKNSDDYGDLLNFSLTNPIDIQCLESYDGSVNLILNDNLNQPRLINTRFTAKENNTYERVDRLGNTDTNIYDESEFDIDTSLLKKYINIPKVIFNQVYLGGNLPIGNYVFYFKLSDADGNETDIVAESGLVTLHIGALNTPTAIRGGEQDEDSGKSVSFTLMNIDSGYDYVNVYFTRTTGVDNGLRTVTATRIENRFRVRQNRCSVHITGNEKMTRVPVSEISLDFFLASKAKTLAICLNMLFMGNVSKFTPDYETLSRVSLGFVPYYESTDADTIMGSINLNYTSGGYYNTKNIYNKVGYWNEEIYRFGIVYIMHNGALSPVYNIRGIDGVPLYNSNDNTYASYTEVKVDYDTQIIKEGTLENSAGVCRINDTNVTGGKYFKIRNFLFKPQAGVKDALEKLNIKGYFFVRLKRIPTILCQAFMIGRDNFSGIPCWNIGDGGTGENGDQWVTETFLDSRGYLTQDYGERLVYIDKNKASTTVALCPEYELNQPYFNNILTGTSLNIKQQTKRGVLKGGENHMYIVDGSEYKVSNSLFTNAKVISVPDSGLVRDGNNIFRAKAGEAESIKYQYLCAKSSKPKRDNFERTKTKIKFAGGRFQLYVQTLNSKVRITRGLYGTFLGVYNIRNNSLETNSLINIYIPGYDVSQMKNYFNIRINCEDAYFAVTDRKELSELSTTTGEKVYRGDCYISQFTHRLNRNFQDPDAPNNDIIIEEDTWVENYDEDIDTSSEINRADLNAVRIGTYFTFRCYSSMNLAMRDWDRGFPSEESLTGCKRGFYPLQPIRTDGNYKIPESCIYNQGFNTSLGEKVNFLLPAVPFIKNCYQTRIVYSDIAQNDAFKNGFRVFRGTAFRDYSNQYGGIMKLVEWSDNLCVIFEHAVGIVKVNQDALIPTDDGTKIAVGAIKVLADTPIMLSTDFGTQWPESVCTSDFYIYGIDTVAKKIWRTDGKKFECISDFKVLKFLNDNITLGERELTPIIGVRNVKTHYNANKKDIMFTFYDNTYGFEEKVWNLCFNEHQDAFTTFYSWVPSYSTNIDNIFFSYNRDTSKWLAKLGINNVNSSNASGICCSSININSDVWSCDLYLKDRPLPTDSDNITYSFTLERDHWGNYNFFTLSGNKLTINNYNGLIANLLNRDPLIPVVQLNISCNISVNTGATFTQSGSKPQWERYFSYNYAMYQSQVHLTFDTLLSKVKSELNGTIEEHIGSNTRVDSSGKPKDTLVTVGSYKTQRLLTDFWKHGQSGIIDVQERIKPCFWYGKQHPFEFEYIAGNDTAGYKRFDNLILSSNNVKPDSIHYTIVGDTYDFSCLKPAMYFRQEATKAFYQYNGSDILYDHEVFDKTYGYIPEMVTSSTYLETDRAGNTVRDKVAYSETYKDALMPLLYVRQDTFNEVEDYYKKISYLNSDVNAYSKGDYPNLTGGEILWDVQFNKFSICNHVKARDVKEVGRTRANIQYINDKWVVQITPLNVYNRNGTWFKMGTHWLPKLVLNNVPEEVFSKQLNVDRALPPELRETDSNTAKYKLGKNGLYYTFWDNNVGSVSDNIDTTPWEIIANGRKEVKLMDKYLKTRIRYKGDELVVILATVTQFNTIG